jgi:hypothetical protein
MPDPGGTQVEVRARPGVASARRSASAISGSAAKSLRNVPAAVRTQPRMRVRITPFTTTSHSFCAARARKRSMRAFTSGALVGVSVACCPTTGARFVSNASTNCST